MKPAGPLKFYSHKVTHYFASRNRDMRYKHVLVGSGIILLLSIAAVINKGLFRAVESPIFDFFNRLPQALHGAMLVLTQFGNLYGLVFWAILGWWLIDRRVAVMVLGTAPLAWWLDAVAKVLVQRGRPLALLKSVHIFSGELFSGYGFPSGHSTVAAACAGVLYYQVPKKYRKYLLFLVLLVGISRMYLGAHFPLDVIGGWALGALIAAVISLVFGTVRGESVTAKYTEKRKAIINP